MLRQTYQKQKDQLDLNISKFQIFKCHLQLIKLSQKMNATVYATLKEFSNKFSPEKISPWTKTKIPIGCHIQNYYQNQKRKILSAQEKRQMIQAKNQRVATASLNYRTQLQNKIKKMQEIHDKKRTQQLQKIMKTQKFRLDRCRQKSQIQSQKQKQDFKRRMQQFKNHHNDMKQFWESEKSKTNQKFRSQSAVNSLYMTSVERKKTLENYQLQKSIDVKNNLLKKHQGCSFLVHSQINKKKIQIHDIHNQEIEQTLKQNKAIIQRTRQNFINKIGSHFRSSSEVLEKNKSALEKKIKDHRIDEYDHNMSIKQNFNQRTKNKSSTLSNCKCKFIHNVQQGITKSIILKQTARHSLFIDTLKKFEKNPSSITIRRSQFISKSQAILSTVLQNKEKIRKQNNEKAENLLNKEKNISDALNLKLKVEQQGNCLVRKAKVK